MVALIKALDAFAGGALVRIKRRSPPPAKDPRSIALIQLWSLGETLLTLPAIKALSATAPVTVFCTARNQEVIDLARLKGVTTVPVPTLAFGLWGVMRRYKKRFDVAIDLEEYLNVSALIAHAVGKTSVGFATGVRQRLYGQAVHYDDQRHVVENFLSAARVVTEAPTPDHLVPLRPSKHDRQAIDNHLRGVAKNAVLVGIAPGAAESGKSRIWPRFVELAAKLQEDKDVFLVFIGARHEKKQVREIVEALPDKHRFLDTTDRVSLGELAALISRLDLLVANDAGPLHLASALGTKVVGLYGPNTPTRFGPFGVEHESLYKSSSCEFSPCINVHKGQVPDCLYAKKSADYQRCMKALGVDEALTAVRRLLRRNI